MFVLPICWKWGLFCNLEVLDLYICKCCSAQFFFHAATEKPGIGLVLLYMTPLDSK